MTTIYQTLTKNKPESSKSTFLALRLMAKGAARAALAVFAASVLGTSQPATAQATSVAVIQNDLGGNMEARLQTIARMRASGTRVEIRGTCASACTMYLGLPNTCVSRGSRLGFHGPQSQYYGISLPPEEFEYWSRVMADHYPGAIRSWFLSEARYTTMDIITLSGAEVIRLGARPCD
ncbi:hypothetical protein [Pseudotabrizicola algicola]|uniref:Uncharacterized protein n=1 Tax=Pseudotabrizicola algicola TaxID=2709381 RepID=A0A6B3RM30_9RHOB|nr:hypothetical protein [Pseudotabrizicola algicola]NEX45325.1 hypothetical protein [Pseudotabrizicola algicola]